MLFRLLTEVHSFHESSRINLPKRRPRGAEEEEGEGGQMKNSGSSEQLDADADSASEVSSEVSFSYEFAQTEVMMKALGTNGEIRPDEFLSGCVCLPISVHFCLFASGHVSFCQCLSVCL